jgi:hypothetical protein
MPTSARVAGVPVITTSLDATEVHREPHECEGAGPARSFLASASTHKSHSRVATTGDRAARDLLTGDFKNAYTSLTNDVVIPGAKQKQISAVAAVPAAASVSANPNHAVALVIVDQTIIVGTGAPTDAASAVRVTMDNVGGRWLISGFDPV